MGMLTEPGLEDLIQAGCAACGGKRLGFRAYLDGRLPLMGGEPVGKLGWAYDGEKFVDGVFEVTCADCKHLTFLADVCPRCHAPGGLAKALETENAYPVPKECPGCESEEVRYLAMVPARVTYEGKRAEKARTSVEIADPSFHGYRVDCKTCGTVAELTDRCPLCDAPGPLRPRP
jgi:hypothetical protein